MSISAYLDVFIGLAFTYLILSLIVTVIFESLAQFTRLRARSLERAIRRMLEQAPAAKRDVGEVPAAARDDGGLPDARRDDGGEGTGEALAELFYEHAIVRSLSKEESVKSASEAKTTDKQPLLKRIWEFLRGRRHFSYIEPRTFALVAMNILFPEEDLGEHDPAGLISLAEKLPDSKVKSVILTHLRAGAKNLQELREGIESWFNDTMDRLSGWFTRTARWISFVIGLIIAVGLNVDTLVVANAFWGEPALRANVVNYAVQNYESFPPDKELTASHNDSLRTVLSSLELPIGWDTYGPGESFVKPDADWLDASWAVAKNWAKWAPNHVIGWLVTAMAVSLGAHFWFDLLSRIIKLRSSGVSPEEKAERKKKQPRTT